MTDERLEQIRVALKDGWEGGRLPDGPYWLACETCGMPMDDVIKELVAEVDRLRANIDKFRSRLIVLSSQPLAEWRDKDGVGVDPDAVTTYTLGLVGGAGGSCGLWTQDEFIELLGVKL